MICHPELNKFDRYGRLLEDSVVLLLTRQDRCTPRKFNCQNQHDTDPHHSALMAQMIGRAKVGVKGIMPGFPAPFRAQPTARHSDSGGDG